MASKEHECKQSLTIKDLSNGQEELKQSISTSNNRTLLLIGIIGIFVFLVGFTASRANDADNASKEAVRQVQKVRNKQDVSDERFKWIEKTLIRIEKGLKEN
jgi:hypothetical protein